MRLTLIALLLFSPAAFAWHTPDEALTKFLAFELAGGRTQSWDFQKYLAVSDEYDKPGWDQVVIVHSYTATPMRCQADRCSAQVTFNLVKTPDLKSQPFRSNPQGGAKTVDFVAVKTATGWLLKPFDDYPHLYEAAYQKLRAPR